MLFNKKSGYHFLFSAYLKRNALLFLSCFSERKIGAIRRVKAILDIRKVIADDFDIAMEIRNRRVCCYIGVDHDAITRAIIPAIFENVVFIVTFLTPVDSHQKELSPAISTPQSELYKTQFSTTAFLLVLIKKPLGLLLPVLQPEMRTFG